MTAFHSAAIRLATLLPLAALVACQSVASVPRADASPVEVCTDVPKQTAMRDLQWTSVATSIAVAAMVEPDDLRIPDVVTALTGVCAPSVKASIMGHILTDDGAVYAITGRTLVPVTDRGGLFKRPSVAVGDLPIVPNARFVTLASVGYHSTSGGLANRYVGLWESSGNWLIIDFSVPDGGGKSVRARTLLSSSLTLRSVAYFPAPDTPSGSLFVVQEASPSEIRLIRMGWTHPN